jgi:uncharacterized protein with GYD domain
MATFVALITFTDQGANRVRDTRKRAAAFRAGAQKAGLAVRDVFWTLGGYDGVLIFDAADDETATAAMLGLAAAGNARTQTLRAFDDAEMAAILARAGGGSAGGSAKAKRRAGGRR